MGGPCSYGGAGGCSGSGVGGPCSYGGAGGCSGGGVGGPCSYGDAGGVVGIISADDVAEYSTVNRQMPSGHRNVTQRSEFGQFCCN